MQLLEKQARELMGKYPLVFEFLNKRTNEELAAACARVREIRITAIEQCEAIWGMTLAEKVLHDAHETPELVLELPLRGAKLRDSLPPECAARVADYEWGEGPFPAELKLPRYLRPRTMAVFSLDQSEENLTVLGEHLGRWYAESFGELQLPAADTPEGRARALLAEAAFCLLHWWRYGYDDRGDTPTCRDLMLLEIVSFLEMTTLAPCGERAAERISKMFSDVDEEVRRREAAADVAGRTLH